MPAERRSTVTFLLGMLRVVVVTFLAVPGVGIALVAWTCQPGPAEDGLEAAAAEPLREAPAPSRLAREVMVESLAVHFEGPAAEDGAVVAEADSVVAEPDPAVATPEPVVAEAEAEPSPEQEARTEAPRVVDAALCLDVERREPVGVGTDFGDDVERLTAWVKVDNPGAPTTVTMIWRHEGEERARLTLDVGTSPGWRTWSRKHVRPGDTGDWAVEVRDEDGRTLRTVAFRVHPAGAIAPLDG
ncbi:MAG: DUF2914 domain-containing protein [Myxococcota bacterium]